VRQRVYEGLCDLSPNGKLFAYFALGGRKADEHWNWTAVSRPPYFSPLALWPGTGPDGGAYFASDSELALLGTHHERKRDQKQNLRLKLVEPSKTQLQLLGWAGLVRNGWMLAQNVNDSKVLEQIVEKRIPQSDWILQRRIKWNTGSVHKSDYVMSNARHRIPLESANWADVDQQGRVVFTGSGKLFAGEIRGQQLIRNELANFNNSQPDPADPPKWALQWPM
jgi:hypothetical protein